MEHWQYSDGKEEEWAMPGQPCSKNQKGESKTEQRAKLLTNDPPLLMSTDRFDCQVKTINCEGMEKMGQTGWSRS